VLPVTDQTRSRTVPYVNVGLIVANILVFLYELTLSDPELNSFFRQHGVIPAQLVDWWGDPNGLGEPMTIYTSAFIHGGWLHLIGNMVYLWVFGDNVEDALGHIKYFFFYFVCAAGAVAAQVFVDSQGAVPVIGASGAIAGVLGAYLVFYPRATVGTLVGYVWYVPVPAVVVIAVWFGMQLLAGIAALGADSVAEQSVAFWAHIGGFVTGAAIAAVARPFVRPRPLPRRRRSEAEMW
jgi:membrane associated rhomboid family serine protease